MKVGLVAVHYPRPEHWDEMISRVPPGGRSPGGNARLPCGRLLAERRQPGRRDNGPVGIGAGTDRGIFGGVHGGR